MTGGGKHYVGAGALLLLVLIASGQPAQAWCIWGFGQCPPPNSILGEYALDGQFRCAKLTITATR